MVSRYPRPPQRCDRGQMRNLELTENPSENHRSNDNEIGPRDLRRSNGGVFGHHLRKKDNNSVRILFSNIGGLGNLYDKKKVDKLDDIKMFLCKHEIDVVGLAETNTDWRTLPVGQSLWSRTSSWFQSRRISTSHNSKTAPMIGKYYQIGGTLTMAIDKVASRPLTIGEDHKGYGRWSWIRMQGKDHKVTRFVTAYCPCKSNNEAGAYSQQLLALARDNRTGDEPRKVFWDDIREAITRWKDQGDQIIIGGDWNSDYDTTRLFFADIGLVDPNFDIHGPNLPITYQRSGGSPIDAFFITAGIEIKSCGFLGFKQLPSDHRGLWIEIDRSQIFGFRKHHVQPKIGRKLTVGNPVVVKRYNRRLKKFLHKQQVLPKLISLHSSATDSPTEEWIHAYESVDQTIRDGQEWAENGCRRIFLGAVPWSPLYKETYDRVQYWKMLLDRQNGYKVDHAAIWKLQKKYKFEDTYSKSKIKKELNAAHNARRDVKKNARAHSMDYRTRLAADLATEGKTSAAQHLINLTQREDTRQINRRVKYIHNKGGTGSTTFVTVKGRGGEVNEITERKELEKAIITENLVKYHQTENHCPLLQDAIIQKIGRLGENGGARAILDGDLSAFEDIASNDTLEFLSLMKRPAVQSNAPVYPSLQDYQQSWKIKKENTSSIGRHFGHYKAAMRDELLACALWMKSYLPMITGYSPDCYRQGTDCMILKKKNSFAISDLRTIVLMD